MTYGTKARRRFERETFIDTAGMDHRQARRVMRRAGRGRLFYLADEFAGGWEPYYDLMALMPERIYRFEPHPATGLPRRPWLKGGKKR